jgi:hypothetical protein
MNDRDRRDSGRLMLISPERVFYAGLLGRPRKRSSGGFNIYTAMQGSLKITGGKSEVVGEVALVRAYVPHSVESEYPSIICLVIEPETVESSAMDGLAARICGAEAPAIAQRIRSAYETLRRQVRRGGFTTQEFDQLSFGERLPDRNMDHRIRRPRPTALHRFTCRHRASCICSRTRPASRFGHFAPGSARGICCTSSTKTSIWRISRKTSAIPTRRISATRSAVSTACSRARFFPAQGIWRSTAAIPACATVPVSAGGGRSGGAGPR